MEFGISFLPDVDPTVCAPADYFAGALELAEMADAGGLRAVKMTEHYLHPYGGYCPSPLGFLAAVAARTTRVRLVTGCILPAFHHPLQLASEAAMVDALSGGRLEVGFARAYLPYEFAAFGVPLDESRARFEATVDTVVRLWTEPGVSVETPFFRLAAATSLPRPTQRPHPPVWCAAVRTPDSFVWAGRRGFGLLVSALRAPDHALPGLIAAYRRAYREHHPHAAGHGRVAISLPLYVADGDAAAARESDAYLRRYLDVWADAAGAWDGVSGRDYAGYTGMGAALRATTPEGMRRERSAVVGSPARVREATRWLGEVVGVDEVLWQVDFGSMPREVASRSLALFLDEVLPHLSTAARGTAARSMNGT
ncbi:MAG TPA: LLM class flavin-dependent oxidoreductase [Longimicrobium sp.]|nr:LLM class flavin-dependent oxidoreductase [Longimicrobium sp.]